LGSVNYLRRELSLLFYPLDVLISKEHTIKAIDEVRVYYEV